ncbi:hypothetical protein AgCh_032171 [Apium graveolens]
MNPHTTASVTSQNVVLQKPLVSPTKVLVDSGNVPKWLNRVRNIVSSVDGTDNDHVSSSSGNIDFGLWRGYAVNFKFVLILNAIMEKYPETFDHFTTKNKKFSTMKLNMFCTSVYDFAKISMTEVDTETIAEYRDVFADLQKMGFDVSWLVNLLNYVEQLWISQPLLPELHAIDCDIDDAKSFGVGRFSLLLRAGVSQDQPLYLARSFIHSTDEPSILKGTQGQTCDKIERNQSEDENFYEASETLLDPIIKCSFEENSEDQPHAFRICSVVRQMGKLYQSDMKNLTPEVRTHFA